MNEHNPSIPYRLGYLQARLDTAERDVKKFHEKLRSSEVTAGNIRAEIARTQAGLADVEDTQGWSIGQYRLMKALLRVQPGIPVSRTSIRAKLGEYPVRSRDARNVSIMSTVASRMLRTLHQAGLVVRTETEVTVLDSAALQAYLEAGPPKGIDDEDEDARDGISRRTGNPAGLAAIARVAGASARAGGSDVGGAEAGADPDDDEGVAGLLRLHQRR